MCSVISDFFDEEDISFLLQLDEVKLAKEKLVKSYTFTIQLTPKMKETLFNKLGLHLTSVPMRWIKGDTKPHIDHGSTKFENTYLVYVTDNTGLFVIDNEQHLIKKNTAFTFLEGSLHETINTGDIPRLLMGPMSEDGIPVGIPPSDISYPGGTVVYITNTDGYYRFTTDYGNFYDINFPCTVTNTDTSQGMLIIKFMSDKTFDSSNYYFICGSSYIQFGSTTLNEDGSIPTFTISNVTDYPGLIQNGNDSSVGYDYIYVFNIKINSSNSNLLAYGGWIGQKYFGKGEVGNSRTYNYIVNCHSTGDIPTLCGGIVGEHCGYYGNVNLLHCSSSGEIGQYSGGIVGPDAGYQATVTCEQCWSEGNMPNEGGGIFGKNGGNYGQAVATNCYSQGNIAQLGGGIFSSFAGASSGSANATNCYSTGTIASDAGGIIGCLVSNDNGSCSITNCFSTGTIASGGSGIVSTHSPGTYSQSNCYSSNGEWSKTDADSNLYNVPSSPSIIGDTWTEIISNSPYVLSNMGYTPYSTININLVDNIPSLNIIASITGDPPLKDMANDEYTYEFNPYEYQSSLFPDLADFIDSNILQGDKSESDRLIASYWDDMGDDIFDDWGYFYLYDVNTGKYYFPLLSLQNQDDGIISTQTFNVFDRTFTIKHGWDRIGIFKFDISVNDNLPFRFGAYGNIGSDDSTFYNELTSSYTIQDISKTLYYHYNADTDHLPEEQLYIYVIPTNDSDNISRPYSVYYSNDDDISIYTNSITNGVTIYFSKGKDVSNYIIHQLKINAGESEYSDILIIKQRESTLPAIVSDKSYQILQKMFLDNTDTYNIVQEDTITIDSTTGSISTTLNTPLGNYKLYIYNTGSYHVSLYYINVIYSGIIANGETDIIYFKYDSGLTYKINDGDYQIPSFPIKIKNTNSSSLLKVLFETDITINDVNCYFICDSDYIQFGSTSLKSTGLRHEITIDNVENYPGLIQNGTSDSIGHNYIYVFNLIVNSNNSNLIEYGGWVGQQNFGRGDEQMETFVGNNYFVNCHTSGDIPSNCGGIVGGDCGHASFITLLHCSSSGEIGQYSGGIVGPNSGYYASVTCEECWSEGNMPNEGGGIFGKNGGNRGQAIATRCYSEGNINYRGGGIFSSFAGASSGSATASHCYSLGTITEDSGGIIGCLCSNDSGNTTVTNCFSVGTYDAENCGIISTFDQGSNTQTNVYAANGQWDRVDADAQLTGIPITTNLGEQFTHTAEGEHYKIHGIGHSPYVQEMITIVEDVPVIVKNYDTNIYYGGSTIRALKDSTYHVLDVKSITPSFRPAIRPSIRPYTTPLEVENVNVPPSSYYTMTLNTSTGQLTTKITKLTTKLLSTQLELTLLHLGSYHITTVNITLDENPNTPICFPAGTPVMTDQGEIAIEKIDPKKNTIRSNPILAVTQTIPLYHYIICIEKDSLGKNVPSRKTFISKDHKVLYQGKMIPAELLPKAIKVAYNSNPLYNVLLKDYSIMEVNKMIVETLHPENPLAKIYTGKYTPQQKRQLISKLNQKNIQQRKSQIIKSNFLQIIHS